MRIIRSLLSLFLAMCVAGTCATALCGCDRSALRLEAEPHTVECRSELSFRSHEKLLEHFEKHGLETGCDSPEAYLAEANTVVCNPDSLHKQQAEDGDDAYFLPRTGEFVVVSSDGYIRTFFIADMDYFNRQ